MTIQATHHQLDRPPFDPVSISPLSFWQRTAEEREASFKILATSVRSAGIRPSRAR
jgi:hypothetical protein